MSDRDAYRAAGQAIAAIAEGLRIDRVTVDGIECDGDDCPAPLRRADALSQIAVGLAGIAAVGRYSFGTPPPGACSAIVRFSFDHQQIADLSEVHGLIASIDPGGDEDILFSAWCQADDLIADDANWDAIEFLAPLIAAGALDGLIMLEIAEDARPSL